MKINPLFLIDGYKCDHRRQYPEGTEFVFSNLTPRKSRVPGVDKIVFLLLQYLVKEYLIDQWNEGFFNRPKDEVLKEYNDFLLEYLGPNKVGIGHIEALHDLGYLPIKIRAVPEGTVVPMRVPVLTIINTNPDFFWLTNYLETLISFVLWKPITSATISSLYRKEFERHAEKTGYDKNFIKFQGHDFSFRGMSGLEDAIMSGAGHLVSFVGTDTIPAIHFIKQYYDVGKNEKIIGCSVAGTEHSVMCAGSKEGEFETFKRLITEVYPDGIISIVSDSWDFWKVMTEYLPALKEEILNRDGRVVIRPDSGNPDDIICGNEMGKVVGGITSDAERKGAYEILWDIFGGTVNEKGFKELNPKIGLIYGDSITLDRQKEILRRLENKGFNGSNLVLGIGSYTYEYVTRDTFGIAMKATWVQIHGKGYEIFKDPVTDSGIKKSAKGLLKVVKGDDGHLKLIDQTDGNLINDEMVDVFDNGVLKNECTFEEIRDRLSTYLKKNN